MIPEERELTPEEARARDAVRGLGPVRPDPAFRERLKSDFVAGRLQSIGAATSEPARTAVPRARPRWSWPRLFVPAFAAAVLLLAVTFANRGPTLSLAEVSGTGSVTVDGRTFDLGDRAALAEAVRPGSRVELPEGAALAVAIDGTMAIELASATATVPRSPGRWFGRSTGCRLELGEIRILTGPGFRGNALDVATPDGLVRVTGTLVSAVRDEGGTCVCVRHGTARVGRTEEELAPVPPGRRMVLFADRRPPLLTEIAPPHAEHLVDFEARLAERAGVAPQ
jgi:ferric-dicitrate binding protein FerR (iron transport regulator)